MAIYKIKRFSYSNEDLNISEWKDLEKKNNIKLPKVFYDYINLINFNIHICKSSLVTLPTPDINPFKYPEDYGWPGDFIPILWGQDEGLGWNYKTNKWKWDEKIFSFKKEIFDNFSDAIIAYLSRNINTGILLESYNSKDIISIFDIMKKISNL